MMNLFLISGLFVAVSAYKSINNDYHNTIGIPEAARIKQAEESADFDGARITGGSSAALGQFPYMGGLIIALAQSRSSVCGSSLISNTRLVTAAHCWKSSRTEAIELTVVLGSIHLYSGGTRINTRNVIVHEAYNTGTIANDIAIIVIDRIEYNNNIRNINIASGSNQYVGLWASAAGFGRTSDDPGTGISQTLNHVDLPVISNDECRRSFASFLIIDSTLCVATPFGRSICNSDSGGPLALGSGNSRQLIGVSSFGHSSGCTSGYPAAFARITSFNAWIRARM